MGETEILKGRKAGAQGEREAGQAVLIELDYLALPGRRCLFESLRSVLGESGADVTEALFMRFCTNRKPEAFLPDLLKALDKQRLSHARILKDVKERYAAALLSDGTPVAPAMRALLGALAERRIRIGGLGGPDEPVLAGVVERLGVPGDPIAVHTVVGSESHAPVLEDWRKLASKLGLRCDACKAVVSGFAGCKSALAAGMPVVCVLDEFTRAHDTGGAVLTLDRMADSDVEAVLRYLS